jgi:hypothetical protein
MKFHPQEFRVVTAALGIRLAAERYWPPRSRSAARGSGHLNRL